MVKQSDLQPPPKSCIFEAMKRPRTISDREYVRGLSILARAPENQAGADKTWVLHFLRRLERLFGQARPAPKNRHGPVR